MTLIEAYDTMIDRKRARCIPVAPAPDLSVIRDSFDYWYDNDCFLVAGDCLEVLSLIDNNSVAVIFTDPPYGINHNAGRDLHSRWEKAVGKGKSGSDRPIQNDNDNQELIHSAFQEFARILVPGGACCCYAGGGGPDPRFAKWAMWLNDVLRFKQMVICDKGPMGTGWHYRRSYETILVAEKPGAPARWYGGTKVENIIRPGQFGIRKILPRKHQHPTEKPVELAMYFLKLHSQPGELVIDPFMGQGSTGIACHRLGRKFLGIELSGDIYEQAINRFQAELEHGTLL